MDSIRFGSAVHLQTGPYRRARCRHGCCRIFTYFFGSLLFAFWGGYSLAFLDDLPSNLWRARGDRNADVFLEIVTNLKSSRSRLCFFL